MTTTSRLALLDAMRGIAALWVALFHVYKTDLLPFAAAPLAQPLHWLAKNGDSGVYIFFAVSGYVIALSVRDRSITPRFVARFALRRSIRLDVPYWATILVVIGLAAAMGKPLPTAPSLAAHAVYLQYFLSEPPILGVFWTLCLELQFYLVFIAVLGVTHAVRPGNIERRSLFVFAPLFVVACALPFLGNIPHVVAASFLPYWVCWFTGALAAWSDRISPAWLFGALALMVVDDVQTPSVSHAIAIAMPALLFVLARRRLLGKSGGRALQLLGAISYSLYLTHMITGELALAWSDLFEVPYAAPVVVGLIAIFLIGALAFAWVFHRVVEAPSHALSRKVSLAATPAATAATATGN